MYILRRGNSRVGKIEPNVQQSNFDKYMYIYIYDIWFHGDIIFSVLMKKKTVQLSYQLVYYNNFNIIVSIQYKIDFFCKFYTL